MTNAKCEVTTYCYCYSLRNGVVSIAIYCVIFAVVDIIYAIVRFSLYYEDEVLRKLFFAVNITDLVADTLMIPFSIILLVAAYRYAVRLVWPWFVYTFIFLVIKLGILAADIYTIVVVTEKQTHTWQYVNLATGFCFMAYHIYGLVVVWHFLAQLEVEKDEMIENARLSDEEEESILDPDGFFEYDVARKEFVLRTKRTREDELEDKINKKKAREDKHTRLKRKKLEKKKRDKEKKRKLNAKKKEKLRKEEEKLQKQEQKANDKLMKEKEKEKEKIKKKREKDKKRKEKDKAKNAGNDAGKSQPNQGGRRGTRGRRNVRRRTGRRRGVARPNEANN